MKLRLPAPARTWTRRAIVLVETAIVLFWLGIALQYSRLIVASALIISYLSISLALTSNPIKTAKVERMLAVERTLEERPFTLTSTLGNDSLAPALLYVSQRFPLSIEVVQGSRDFAVFVPPRSTVTVSSTLRAVFRGHYVLPTPMFRASDELGLREREIKAAKPSFLTVLPPIEDLSDFSLDSRTAQPEIGTFRSSSVGVGTEFFGIRKYLPGDELRRINWKASARTDSLLSNEYEREHVTNIYLFVDLCTGRMDALKWTVRTAASVGTYLLKTRNRLGLVVLGESTSHVPIESGRRQLLKVLDKLVTAEPGGTGEPSTYLLRLIEDMPKCQVLLVTALASEAISKTVTALRQKQNHVAVITRTPKSWDANESDLVLKAALLMRSLRHRAAVQQIKNADVALIEVSPDRSIRTALGAVIERPLRR